MARAGVSRWRGEAMHWRGGEINVVIVRNALQTVIVAALDSGMLQNARIYQRADNITQ